MGKMFKNFQKLPVGGGTKAPKTVEQSALLCKFYVTIMKFFGPVLAKLGN